MAVTVIVGLSCTGKSTLAKTLAATSHKGAAVFCLDTYVLRCRDNDIAVAHAMQDIQPYLVHGTAIVEGCIGYQIMIKWLRLFKSTPTDVHLCYCSRNVRYQRHVERGTKIPTQQDVMLSACHNTWESLMKQNTVQPNIHVHDTTHLHS